MTDRAAENDRPVMTVEEFHRFTGGEYLGVSDEQIGAMISAMTVCAEILCEGDAEGEKGGRYE